MNNSASKRLKSIAGVAMGTTKGKETIHDREAEAVLLLLSNQQTIGSTNKAKQPRLLSSNLQNCKRTFWHRREKFLCHFMQQLIANLEWASHEQ
jgi:hypothetical protein